MIVNEYISLNCSSFQVSSNISSISFSGMRNNLGELSVRYKSAYNNAEEDYVVATNVVPDHDVPDSKTAVNIKWYNA